MDPPECFEKFRDEAFLSSYTLNSDIVLEYFCRSGFFDPNSLNQQRRKGMTIPLDADGTEFRLIYENSAARDEVSQEVRDSMGPSWNFPNAFGVFVIQRIRREKGQETPMECFYILGGTIYKSPTLAAVVWHRLTNCLRHFDEAIDEVTKMCRWSLSNGYSWGPSFAEPQPASSDDEDDDDNEDYSVDCGRLSLVTCNDAKAPQPVQGGDSAEAESDSRWTKRWKQLSTEMSLARDEKIESAGCQLADTSRPRRRGRHGDQFAQEDTAVSLGTANVIFSARTSSNNVDHVLRETFSEAVTEGKRFGEAVTQRRLKWVEEVTELRDRLLALGIDPTQR